MILKRWGTNDGYKIQSVRARNQHSDGRDAPARVFHIEQDEVGIGSSGDSSDTSRTTFEYIRPYCATATPKYLVDFVLPHVRSLCALRELLVLGFPATRFSHEVLVGAKSTPPHPR
jgi:hypothetical protein